VTLRRDSYRDEVINALLTFAGPQVLYEDLPDEVRRVCKQAADLLSAGPNSEAKIREDEARQIMLALDAYGPAADYGPPIEERIALHSATYAGPK